MENKNLKQRIIKNSFWSFVSSIINRGGSFIFTIILARFLIPEDYGIYLIVLSTAMIFFIFQDLGINTAFNRYLASSIKTNIKQISAYHNYFFKLKFFLSLGASLLFLILSYPLSFYVFKNPELFHPFLIASFYIFVLSLDLFYTQVFYSTEKVKYTSFKESINSFLRIIFALGVFYFLTSNYYVFGIFLSFILISLFMILFSLYYIKKLIPEFYLKSKIKIDKRRIRRFVGILTIASISGVFFSYVDSIMLGIFVSAEYVGYYGVAFALIGGVSSLIAFPNIILLPIFTKLKNQTNDKIFRIAFKYISIISIPSIFGLLILGKYFINFLFGSSYLPSLLPFYFLSILIFPTVLIGLFLSFFSAKEKPEIFAKLILITGLINIILNFIFIKLFLLISPLWATAGAAIATLISWTIYFIGLIYFMKKEFNFSVPFNSLAKSLIASLIMFGILFYILRLIPEMNLIYALSTIFLGVLVYFIIMLFIGGIKKQDLDLLRLSIKK